ncbi:sorbitol dehydrogenase-like [Diadema antillarum]|uniref:sorbitol dehydrogenase-like n=1 Tax=Diadema antillarum TaxID=105358 RepID=UPI003A8654A8
MMALASAPDGNLSVVLHAKDKIVLEDSPIPEPKENEVQLKMAAVGICGSDIHIWSDGSIGDLGITSPKTLGHEASGTVTAVGSNVTSLKVGDRVALEPGIPCLRCDICKGGRYNVCPSMLYTGLTVDGGLRRYACHPAEFCFKLPDHVSLEEGALLEPLCVAIHACRRASVYAGSKVLICGAGPIGLLCLLTVRVMGAASIVITDLVQSRLDKAVQLGADHAVLVDSKDVQEMVKRIHTALGDKPNITLECTGAPAALQTAIHATQIGGVVTLVGLGPYNIDLPIILAAFKELDVRGAIMQLNCFPTALDMIASGKVNAKPIITHHFKLSEAMKAFETAKAGADGAIKVMIHCDQ